MTTASLLEFFFSFYFPAPCKLCICLFLWTTLSFLDLTICFLMISEYHDMRFQIGYDYDHFSLHGCTICVKINCMCNLNFLRKQEIR